MNVFKYDGPGPTAPTPTKGPTVPAPTKNPVVGGPMYKFVACFEDDGNNRVLSGPSLTNGRSMTTEV